MVSHDLTPVLHLQLYGGTKLRLTSILAIRHSQKWIQATPPLGKPAIDIVCPLLANKHLKFSVGSDSLESPPPQYSYSHCELVFTHNAIF
jgi:hypothetical protein